MCIKCLAEVTILIKVRHYFSSNHHHNKKHALLWLTFFFQSVSWSSWLGFLLPTPVLLPGKSHGRRSLVGCSPWGRWELDMTHDFTFTFHFHALEKKMATHSSVLAWRIPGTAEPGGLPSMGSYRVGHNWSDLAAAAAAEADQFSQHHLLKRLCFFHCIFFPPLSKIRYP